MAVSCMRNASRHNYRNSSVIMDLAMGQIPRYTERLSSNPCFLSSLIRAPSGSVYCTVAPVVDIFISSF